LGFDLGVTNVCYEGENVWLSIPQYKKYNEQLSLQPIMSLTSSQRVALLLCFNTEVF